MDISNKALAILLVAAIVVSVAGTILSLDRIGRYRVQGPSGFATSDAGNVSLIVSKVASIRWANNSVNWGSGTVASNATSNKCSMETNGTGFVNTTWFCVGFQNSTGLILENNGTMKVSVRLNFSGNETFLGAASGVTGVSPEFYYNVTYNESGSCTAGFGSNHTIYGTSWMQVGNVTNEEPNICSSLQATDQQDSLRIDFRVDFNSTIAQGTKNISVTAIATAAE